MIVSLRQITCKGDLLGEGTKNTVIDRRMLTDAEIV